MPDVKTQTVAERWSHLHQHRQALLHRARMYSALTIPSVLPESGTINHEELPVPNNNMPAEGLNNLSARIVSVALPLNGLPIFELLIDMDQFDDQTRAAAELEFRRMERSTMGQLHPTNLRDILHEAVIHLEVTGNAAIEQLDDFNFRLWRFDQYVVKRYTDGRWYEVITADSVNPKELPPELADLPMPPAGVSAFGVSPMSRPGEQTEAIFTRYQKLDNGSVKITKEFRGETLESYERTVSPITPLRWKSVTGEDYGRGEAEESYGDLLSLDSISRGMIDGALLNAEHRWRISPLSLVSIDDFMDSTNGEAIAAEEGEIGPLQFQNHAQVGSALTITQHLEKRLGRRFLMNSAIQPTGERVTARQVTILAEELEATLGGVLSMLTRDLLIPFVRNTMYLMSVKGLITPELQGFLGADEDLLKIRIRAGLEILQREAEFEKLSMLVEQVRNLPPEAQRVFRWPNLIQRWITNMGIDPVGMVKTPEEVADEMIAEQEQQQAMAMQQQAAQMQAQAGPPGQAGPM